MESLLFLLELLTAHQPRCAEKVERLALRGAVGRSATDANCALDRFVLVVVLLLVLGFFGDFEDEDEEENEKEADIWVISRIR